MNAADPITMPHRLSRVVALLSGDESRDEVVREALSRLGARVSIVATADVGEVLEAASERAGTLWILDAASERFSLKHLRRDWGEAPTILLLGTDHGTEEVPAGIEHCLARPFRARTLAVLCVDLLEASAAAGAEEASADSADEELRTPARVPSLFRNRLLYTEACRYVEGVLAAASAGRKPKVVEARVLAERIHTSLLQGNRLLLMALEPYERFELPLHCVNVALLAGKIAMGLRWGVDDVLRAIEAGLLHDIGMARLPEHLLVKKGKLTEGEWELVRRHPEHGAEIAARLGKDHEWLRLAILQEHERLNGQGYPAGLSGEEIGDLAKVIAVADVFEAFSHPRTYRSLFTAYEALERVVGLREELLASDVIAALVNEISAFPLDSFVLLSTGEIGRVVNTNPANLMRPVVQTVWDPLWEPVDEPRTLDLMEETAVSVARPLHETELPIT